MTKKTIAKRLSEHRQIVIAIIAKTNRLTLLRDKIIKLGGSIIEPYTGIPEGIIAELQLIEDINAEIALLEECRRQEYVYLKPLSDQLQSMLQRQVIECYYYGGLSLKETADVIYGTHREAQKKSCRAAIDKGRAAMISIKIKEVDKSR